MADLGIEVILDPGTSKACAAYVVTRKGKRVSEPAVLFLYNMAKEVPCMAAFHNGRFIHGFELRDATLNDANLASKVITLWKLNYYPSPETSQICARNEDKLGGRTVDDLVSAHLKAIIHAIKEAIGNSQEKLLGPQLEQALDSMCLRITAPEIFSPHARQRMQKAVRGLGLKTVVLASESECSLAYLVRKISRNEVALSYELGKGDRIVTVDLGCGTADLVIYQLLEALNQHSRIEAVGHASGDVCGGHRVNEIIWSTLKQRMGDDWLQETAEKLRIPQAALELRSLNAIEKAKLDFNERDWMCKKGLIYFTIPGDGPVFETCYVQIAEIKAALDQVILRNFEAIDKEIASQKNVKAIFITGGFSRSGYLMKRLKEEYEEKRGILVVRPNETDNGECHAVALGGLHRFKRISQSPLPSRYGYAVLQDEEYEQFFRLDDEGKKTEGKHKFAPDSNHVKKCVWDGTTDVIENCIVNIIPKGTILGTESVKFEPQDANIYYVPHEHPEISARFVYLTEKVADHMPIMTLEKKWRHGVHDWMEVQFPIETDQGQMEGFEIVELDNKLHWKIYAKPTIECCGQDIRVGFDVLQPDGLGGHGDEVAWRVQEAKIWEAAASDFYQQGHEGVADDEARAGSPVKQEKTAVEPRGVDEGAGGETVEEPEVGRKRAAESTPAQRPSKKRGRKKRS